MTFPKSFQVGGAGLLTIRNITAAYTVQPSDNNGIINCTKNTFTVSLTAAAILGSGFNVQIWNTSTTATNLITIDPAGAETIDGNTTIAIYPGNTVQLICTGTAWETSVKLATNMIAVNPTLTVPGPIASAGNAIAIGQNSTASGSRSIAIGFGTVASSGNSTAIGYNNIGQPSQAVTGVGATALGGSYASGADSFAVAIGNNTATYGARAANAIAIGQQATATVAGAVAIGAQAQATGSGGYCVAIGYQSQATSPGAVAIGNQYNVAVTQATGSSAIAIGDGVVAQGQYSISLGAAAKSFEYGKFSRANGFFAAVGDNQVGGILLRIATTDATATRLTSDAGAASTTNQLILQNNQAMVVTGSVLCRQSVAGSDKASGWTFSAVIRRGANAGTTALVAAVTPILVAQDVSLATTVLAVTADTTNGGLAVTVTGIAATNLRWVATLDTAEVIYA